MVLSMCCFRLEYRPVTLRGRNVLVGDDSGASVATATQAQGKRQERRAHRPSDRSEAMAVDATRVARCFGAQGPTGKVLLDRGSEVIGARALLPGAQIELRSDTR